MPPLLTSKRIGEQASTIGFDWETPDLVIDKIKEELSELEEEIKNIDPLKTEEELGDLLFAISNLARKLNINPENAIHKANQKFIKRFRIIEKEIDKNPKKKFSSAELERFWEQSKKTVSD